MNIKIIRTNSTHFDFSSLVTLLNMELAEMNGEQDSFFNQFNNVNVLNHVVIAYHDEVAVGCGAFKPYSENTVEIKRMFVSKSMRGQGVAQEVLNNLESWANELGYKEAILETGNPVAVCLYKKCNYEVIPNYDQYIGVESSVCMKKNFKKV